MKAPFKIDRSFTVRHKILEVLHRDWDTNNKSFDRRVGSIKVAKNTGIPIAEIDSILHLLVNEGEIVISDNDGQSMISIQQKGIASFVSNRYLKEGKKEMWDSIYAWARILIPSLALLLSLYSIYSNKKLNTRIDSIETKVLQFKK